MDKTNVNLSISRDFGDIGDFLVSIDGWGSGLRFASREAAEEYVAFVQSLLDSGKATA